MDKPARIGGCVYDIVQVEEPFDGLGILQIQSVMFWPGDEQGQGDFMAAAYKVQMIHMEAKPPEAEVDPGLQELLVEWSQLFGGWPTLADSSPLKQITPETAKRFAEGEIVGLVFCLLCGWSQHPDESMGKPSLNKIYFLLENIGKDIVGENMTRLQVFTLWKKYRAVAHLWGAYHLQRKRFRAISEEIERCSKSLDLSQSKLTYENYVDTWKLVLVTADKLQDFGMRFIPVGGKEPLLDPLNACIVSLPEGWEGKMPDIIFPEALREPLKAYRAPKSF